MESEADALAAWCAMLPALRERARQEGVLDRLNRDADRVSGGGSARPALRKWQPEDQDQAQRTWSDRPTAGLPRLPGWGAAAGLGAGAYVCPQDRCNRRAARDDDGHPPNCAAFGTPMRPA
ncbi:hypothetical protein [Actinoplanes sp. NPDC020271]|uniref:hypothetical protein n=1 Tax=Actinoplanes sp. NPDC020271 TaxID=3363896 RepID=UPI00379F9A6F